MGSETDRLIGANVARVRVERAISQEAVALGMRERNPDHKWSQATVWSVERGDRALKANEVHDLSKVLRVGALIFIIPDQVGPTIIDLNGRGGALRQSMVRVLAAMDEADQARVALFDYIASVDKRRKTFTEDQWAQIEPHRADNQVLVEMMDRFNDGVAGALKATAAELDRTLRG